MKWTISELDALHARVGLGDLWLASDRRREILADVTIPGEVVIMPAELTPARPSQEPTP